MTNQMILNITAKTIRKNDVFEIYGERRIAITDAKTRTDGLVELWARRPMTNGSIIMACGPDDEVKMFVEVS